MNESTQDLARREFARREYERRKATSNLSDFCFKVDEFYQTSRHIKFLCENLEALERREIQNLIVEMPPRHSKSLHVSERFPAYFLGKRKRTRIILAGNSAELAEGSSRKVRNLVEDERYPFDVHVDQTSRAVNRWHTDAGGEVIAVGVGSSLTGRGADLLSIDDPVKDRMEISSVTQRNQQWEWYTDVARTRLMPGGLQLVTMTRWHDDDLVGRIMNSNDASKWRVVCLPALAVDGDILGRHPGEALWPEWYNSDALLREKSVRSPQSWASLYQQNPVPDDGTIFRAEWFNNRYKELPERFVETFNVIGGLNSRVRKMIVVQSIDSAWKTGASNDFSVIATWGVTDTHYYLLNIWRKRVEYPDLVKAVQQQHDEWLPNAIYVEEAASGQAIVQHFKASSRLPIIGIRPSGTKEARADLTTPAFAGGKVMLPEESIAPWINEWIHEHLRFPAGAHDDQVDTTSLGLGQLLTRTASIRGGRSNRQVADRLSNWMER